jgi:DNA-binding response OmpR family regulator
MTKILLVEDDSNLREIYAARLEAEGYQILSANDGEEALAIAVKEHPNLIISDIMMPKISGFDMLDILRSTPETKDTKVIMMTALSQDEDKKRGKQLGADHYIVKSQVTLDDVVSIVREILGSAQQPSAGSAQDDATKAQTDEEAALATIDQEVQQFVASSPLMNGTAPQPTKAPEPENTEPNQAPPQAA